MNDTNDDLPNSTQKFWQKAQELFSETLEMRDDQRETFLRERCGEDVTLFAEVSSLVESYDPDEDDFELSPAQAELCDVSVPRDAVPGYEIYSEIHRGGQGVVYRALQLGTNREVAIKFLLAGPFTGEQARRRFQREVELVCQLRHTGIVPVFDSGVAAGQPFFVMEYVSGQRLQDYVASREVSQKDLLNLMIKICDAAGFAHHEGVVHRDLKPSNILVSETGEPRVLDFGLAKPVAENDETLALSITGQIMGTIAYMSPEQAAGNLRHMDARSDVYSLAVILYEMLADRKPYSLDGSIGENLIAIKQDPVEPLCRSDRNVSIELESIVMKGLSKEQADRYADAAEMSDDLRRCLRGEKIEAKLVGPPPNRSKFLRLFAYGLASAMFLAFVVWMAFEIRFGSYNAAPQNIPPALRPLEENERYTQAEFESQLDALRDYIRADSNPEDILEQFRIRFGTLKFDDFEESLTPQRKTDLELVLDLYSFLEKDRTEEEIEKFLARRNAVMQGEGIGKPSGLSIDTTESILEMSRNSGRGLPN